MMSNLKPWHRLSGTWPDPVWRRWQSVALAVLFAVGGAGGQAQTGLTVPRGEEDAVRDVEVQLPVFPANDSLIPFPTDWTRNQVFVDGNTLKVADDGVVSYALVVRSPSGADNVSFESMRCATGERRVHAYGRKTPSGPAWSPARNANWQAISDRGINRYYFEFWRDVFCDGKRAESHREIVANLRRGGRERPFSQPSE